MCSTRLIVILNIKIWFIGKIHGGHFKMYNDISEWLSIYKSRLKGYAKWTENEKQKKHVYAGSNGHKRLLRKRLKYNYENGE